MSADSIKAQKNFCSKQEFPFQLLSDPEKEVIKSYENSKIEKVYEKVSPKTHAAEVLKDLV